MITEKNRELRLNRSFAASTRALLALFICSISLAVLAGIASTPYDLRLILSARLHTACKPLLIDMVIVVVLTEAMLPVPD